MATVTGDILVRRPVEVVFDYVADQTNEPSYNPQMTSSVKITDGPIDVGTRFHASVKSAGRPADMTIEITEFHRPVRFGSRTTMQAAHIVGGLDFTAVTEGTRMSWSWQVTPTGLTRWLAPLVVVLGRRQERRIWTGLKQHLERAAVSGGSGSTAAG